MTGKLFIDNIDTYAQWGVFVHRGGYSGLVQWPPLKTPDTNDWPEEDGLEVDLRNPKLDTRTFNIQFAGVREFSIRELVNHLSDGAYHQFDFREIGIRRTLRLTNNSARKTVGTIKTFTLDFADDNPLDGYTPETPTRVPTCWQTGFAIDGIPLSNYGVWVTNGTHDEIVKAPSVKQNLLVNTPAINGAQYDGHDVFFQAKDVRIKCHLRADVATFWRNYLALLHNLTTRRNDPAKPNGEHTFYYGRREEEYPCYYKSANVTKFSKIGGELLCNFDITLVFTSFRFGGVEYVLASQTNEIIVSEDEVYMIDCR